VFSGFTYSQKDFEYGKQAELKGLTKIFVDTGTDLKNRERITGEIEKAKLPDVEMTESADAAQIILLFRGETEEVVTGATTNTYGTTMVNRANLANGSGIVFIEGKNKNKPRLILSISNSQQTKLEKKPSVKFAKEFVKAYKEANNLK